MLYKYHRSEVFHLDDGETAARDNGGQEGAVRGCGGCRSAAPQTAEGSFKCLLICVTVTMRWNFPHVFTTDLRCIQCPVNSLLPWL